LRYIQYTKFDYILGMSLQGKSGVQKQVQSSTDKFCYRWEDKNCG